MLLTNKNNNATALPTDFVSEIIAAQQTLTSIQQNPSVYETFQSQFSYIPPSIPVNSDPSRSTIEHPMPMSMSTPLQEAIFRLNRTNGIRQIVHHNQSINIYNALDLQPQTHEPSLTLPQLLQPRIQQDLNETETASRFREQFLGRNQHPSLFEHRNILCDERYTAQLFTVNEGSIQNLLWNPYVSNNIVPTTSGTIDNSERPIDLNWLYRRVRWQMDEALNNSYDPNSQSIDR
jgi:hypothetical protein